MTVVNFGPNVVTDVSCTSSTTCTASSPAGTGTVDVVVETSDGTSNALQFTYFAPLVLTGVDPISGPASGGTVVTFTGSGFDTTPGGTTFDVDQVPFLDASCSSATRCTALSPPVSCAEGTVRFDTIEATAFGQQS